jgi:acyl carrier protein
VADPIQEIEKTVLNIHRRNGGTLQNLDLNLRLLDPVLMLDSLDLAEIMVDIEKRFHCSPFDASTPPRTWANIIDLLPMNLRP